MRENEANGSPESLRAGLKEVMRRHPQGVTVVTTETESGPKGITVSSFTSVSLDPPLVLISLARGSELHDLFVRVMTFAVNLLADDQKQISDIFAGRTNTKDRFEGVKFHRGSGGSPILDGALAALECDVWRVYDGGDHSIILGEVRRITAMIDGRPLVYYDQRYTTTELVAQPSPPSDILR